MAELNEIESLLFPDKEAVADYFLTMTQSMEVIIRLEGDTSAEAIDVVQRNKDYLTTSLAYTAIQEAGVDLSAFYSVLVA